MKAERFSGRQCREQDCIFKKMDVVAKLMDGKFPEKFGDCIFFQDVLSVDGIGEFSEPHIQNLSLEYDGKDCAKLTVYDCRSGNEQIYSIYQNGFILDNKKMDKSQKLLKYDFVAEKLELLLSSVDDHLSGSMERIRQEGLLCF